MATPNKQEKLTLTQEIDMLINIYEQQKKNPSGRIQINVTPEKLNKAFGYPPKFVGGKETWKAEIPYRGRTLVAVGE